MDLFAAEIGMDPAEVRRRNLLRPDQFPLTTKGGAPYDSGEYEKALDKVLDAAGYADLRAEQAARRERGDAVQIGIGVSVFVEITGGGAFKESAAVEVHPDGTVTVLTGTSPARPGARHGLGDARERAPRHPDREDHRQARRHRPRSRAAPAPWARGACRPAAWPSTRRRASWWRWPSSGRPTCWRRTSTTSWWSGARSSCAARTPAVSLADLAEREKLRVDTRFDSGAPTFPFGAHVAVALVDVESGKAVIDKIVTIDDAGPVLNPLIAEGQRHGGIAQGIAQALLEEVVYDEDGNPVTATFADYGIPSAAELPSFTLLDMATPTHLNPLGVKGIGEAGTIGATPAVQSAVIDALAHLGVRHIDMPLTPLRVWEAIEAARSAGGARIEGAK